MTQTANLANELESNSAETMNTAKLMRFVELIIKLDNERLKAEREAEVEEKPKEELKEKTQ